MEVTFDPAIWQNGPAPAPGTERRIGLRAIYESKADTEAKKNGIWTGRVVSPEHTYVLFR